MGKVRGSLAIVVACAALVAMGATTAGAADQATSGVVTSGSSSYKIFSTTRTTSAGGNTYIYQSGSNPGGSVMRYHLYRCDSAVAITNPYLIAGDGQYTRNVSLLTHTCFRLGARRDEPKDTNGWGVGSGNTTFYITVHWP